MGVVLQLKSVINKVIACDEDRTAWPEFAKDFAIFPKYIVDGNGRLSGDASIFAVNDIPAFGGAKLFVASAGNLFVAMQAVAYHERVE